MSFATGKRPGGKLLGLCCGTPGKVWRLVVNTPPVARGTRTAGRNLVRDDARQGSAGKLSRARRPNGRSEAARAPPRASNLEGSTAGTPVSGRRPPPSGAGRDAAQGRGKASRPLSCGRGNTEKSKRWAPGTPAQWGREQSRGGNLVGPAAGPWFPRSAGWVRRAPPEPGPRRASARLPTRGGGPLNRPVRAR